MRVISQKQDLSFEFEQAVLSVNDTCVCAKIGDMDAIIGAYESSERAKEVFKELHEVHEYDGTQLPFYFSKGFCMKTPKSACYLPKE